MLAILAYLWPKDKIVSIRVLITIGGCYTYLCLSTWKPSGKNW